MLKVVHKDTCEAATVNCWFRPFANYMVAISTSNNAIIYAMRMAWIIIMCMQSLPVLSSIHSRHFRVHGKIMNTINLRVTSGTQRGVVKVQQCVDLVTQLSKCSDLGHLFLARQKKTCWHL